MSEKDWGNAQEVQSNWFKFKTVGDKIKGTKCGEGRFQAANLPGYQDQWVYELKTEDGGIWNVGIPASKAGTIARINNCKVGEIIGIIYEKDGDAQKGKQPAKLLKVVTFGMDTTFTLTEAFGGEEINVNEAIN